MMVALLILMIGLTPSLVSLWIMRQADAQAQERLRHALEAIAHRGLPALQPTPDLRYIEGIGLLIGDFTCRYNARSRYLRCAINPSGPCEGCRQYDPVIPDESVMLDS
ncbi:hypothetical protein HNI00_19500 [Thermoleptolyngbya oregonensis NK1-22]|uniref:Uncharacterized protein n=2 Tax=Oculatellaceae TaxID=2303507 RepID=A0AA97BE07_9CYAN|nr:hypothetical protein HNI00_19500 [Thermoleptolyngbya oregonensis NK1-22]HIK40643.1 hypothetical protein [Thermoleptolyngbya sp. M55_K2018_002]